MKKVWLLVILMAIVVLAGSMVMAKTRVNFVAARYHTGITDDYWAKVANEFEAANPDIDMTVDVVDWGTLHMKLTTMIGAGEPPELANIATIWLPEYIAADVAEPLDRYMTPEFKDQFIGSLFDITFIDNKLYGIPIAVSARAMYYLKEPLEKVGMAPPKNWDELLAVAQAIHNPPGLYGFGIPCTTWEGEAYFAYFLWAAGGEFFDKTGKFVVDSPEGVEAMEFLVDLARKYKVTYPEPWAINRDEMHKVFAQGKIGMFIVGPWEVGIIKEENPDLNYGITLIPAYRKQVTMAVTDTLMMYKGAPNKDAAWKFVEFAYQDKYRLEFDVNEGMLPEKKVVGEKIVDVAPYLKTFINLLPYGKFLPMHVHWEEITGEIVKQMQLAYMGEKTPRDALDDTAREVNTRIIIGF